MKSRQMEFTLIKTEAVSNYPVPRNAKELKQFLGLSNYYRRFIKDYSKIAEPLFKLLSKEGIKNFSWSSSCQSAFEDLNHRLTDHDLIKPLISDLSH